MESTLAPCCCDMKKIVSFCFAALLLVTAHKSYAQEVDTFTVGFEAPISLYGNTGLKTLEWTIDVGYNIFDWLAVSAKTDLSAGMLNENNTKTYFVTETLGAGLSFYLLKKDFGVLSVRVFSGTVFNDPDWRYTYYSGGVYYSFGNGKFKPAIGFGVKYYNTNKIFNIDDYLRIYCSFGFRFN